MSDLSLFDIERGLHELMDAWQEATAPEAVAEAEAAIQVYAAAEVRKVDGIRRYLRGCKEMAAAASAEAKAQSERARMWEARGSRLKQFCYEIMQSFGVRKLEGQTGSLSIRGNGGVQPLVITDEALIPDELCVWQGEIDGHMWARIIASVLFSDWDKLGVRMVRTPNKTAIRAVLEGRCEHCNGGPAVGHGDECQWCNHTGKGSVAGARLDSRGEHLDVR